MKRFLAAIFLAFTPLPAQAIDFDKVTQPEVCAAITEIIKLRETKFKTVLGEPSKYSPKTQFKSTHETPGTKYCDIRLFGSVNMYTCVVDHPFARGDVGNRQALAYLEKVHARFAACLKPYTTSREPTLNGTAIIYNIPPYPPDNTLASAVVLSTIHNTVYIQFNALND
jgi:hypothetical protein